MKFNDVVVRIDNGQALTDYNIRDNIFEPKVLLIALENA